MDYSLLCVSYLTATVYAINDKSQSESKICNYTCSTVSSSEKNERCIYTYKSKLRSVFKVFQKSRSMYQTRKSDVNFDEQNIYEREN